MFLKTNRIAVKADAANKLKILKGRTGLTPNILCRIAICMSLNTKATVESTTTDETGLEFNKFTLLGENEALLTSLLVQYHFNNTYKTPTEGELLTDLKWHLNRGVNIVYSRVKNLQDLI